MKILDPKNIDWAESVSLEERDQFQANYDKTSQAAFERLHAALCDVRNATIAALPMWFQRWLSPR